MTVYEVRSADEGLEAAFPTRAQADQYVRTLATELAVACTIVAVEVPNA